MESVQTLGFGFDSSFSRRVNSFVDLTSSGWLFALFRNRNAMLFARVMSGGVGSCMLSSGQNGWDAACAWQVLSKRARHVFCIGLGAQGYTAQQRRRGVCCHSLVMMWLFQGCPVGCPACWGAELVRNGKVHLSASALLANHIRHIQKHSCKVHNISFSIIYP